MDDLDDQLLDQEEMNDMFSRPIGQDVYLNDADLESGSLLDDALKNFLNAFFLFVLVELAGLAESEFGMDSGAMYDDLHAPSVPVQPINAGATAAAASKVC